jgi:hypothetical protein
MNRGNKSCMPQVYCTTNLHHYLYLFAQWKFLLLGPILEVFCGSGILVWAVSKMGHSDWRVERTELNLGVSGALSSHHLKPKIKPYYCLW